MKKTTIQLFAIIVVAMTMLTSCKSTSMSMREANVRVQLSKSDFTLSDQVSGEATTTKILGIDFARLFKSTEGTVVGSSMAISAASIPVIGSFLADKTSNYALYEMMTANKGYDVVIYPQYETTSSSPILGLGFLFNKTTVKATARLGKLNK